jgi:hypothetical protein
MFLKRDERFSMLFNVLETSPNFRISNQLYGKSTKENLELKFGRKNSLSKSRSKFYLHNFHHLKILFNLFNDFKDTFPFPFYYKNIFSHLSKNFHHSLEKKISQLKRIFKRSAKDIKILIFH